MRCFLTDNRHNESIHILDMKEGKKFMFNSFLDALCKFKTSNAVLYIIIGALLFLVPNLSLGLVCYGIGALLIYKGVMSFMSYQQVKQFYGLPIDLVACIGYVIFGLVMIFAHGFFLSMIPMVIGIFMIADGVQTLLNASSLKKQGYGGSNGTTIRGILVIILGIVIFVNPFGAITTTLRVIGIILIIDGISELVDSYNISRWMR